MKENSTELLNTKYLNEGIKLVEYIDQTRTQHIGEIPSFEQLTSRYIKTNRKVINIFLKFDDKVMQPLKSLSKSLRKSFIEKLKLMIKLPVKFLKKTIGLLFK